MVNGPPIAANLTPDQLLVPLMRIKQLNFYMINLLVQNKSEFSSKNVFECT